MPPPKSFTRLTDQAVPPSAALRQHRSPRAPRTYTEPPSTVGVPRGPPPQPVSYPSPSFFAGRGTFHTGLPSFVPRHRACSFSPFSSSSAAVTNSLSPTTAGLEKPTPPRFAFHASGGPPW